MSPIIHDGHTLVGWINETRGLYPRIEFTFRRMTCEEFAEFLDIVAAWKEKQTQRLICTHVANRIYKWDYDKPLSEETVLNETRSLVQRLWRIIAGLEGPDGLVGQHKSDADADYRAALEAARTSRPLRQIQEETEQKNSH